MRIRFWPGERAPCCQLRGFLGARIADVVAGRLGEKDEPVAARGDRLISLFTESGQSQQGGHQWCNTVFSLPVVPSTI